mmetsp:Transcript_18653/g.42658  ORF Transcript_18653/g.42658 Transcript_18653/m.42658 type:complete len:273 (-) Transcript_18653:13849-14667(-)
MKWLLHHDTHTFFKFALTLITQRWANLLSRTCLSCWQDYHRSCVSQRLNILILRRRIDVITLLESLVGWANVRTDRISREKVVMMWRQRTDFTFIRGILQMWESAFVLNTRQRHAATIICRRKTVNLVSCVYRRWSNWSFTSRIDRKLKIQIRNKLIRHAEKIEIAFPKELPARCRSQEDLLIRILNRVFTKLLRNVLRRWSMALAINKKKKFANSRAAKRNRMRTFSIFIEAWSSFLDRTFLLHQIQRKISTRHNFAVVKVHTCTYLKPRT